MKMYFVKISGMTCDNCKEKVKNSLLKVKGIKDVYINGNIAYISYTKLTKKDIVKAIDKVGYKTSEKLITDNIKDLKKITIPEFIILVSLILLLIYIINKLFGFNVFNMIPTIDSKESYIMLFIIGILTSIHCISMCGAINLYVSTNHKTALLYNLGRIISYTIIGGICGLVGNILSINKNINGIIIILSGLFMLLMSLNMLGLINLKTKKISIKPHTKNSFIIGLLNGLMPCGPLQAMQLYAVSTSNLLIGAFSMFVFSLGTLPLMLLIGIIKNKFSKELFKKITSTIIFILAISMILRGFNYFNISLIPSTNYLKSDIKNNIQTVQIDLDYDSYKDIYLKKGIPVKFIIKVNKDKLTGCNNKIIINKFNIEKELKEGENIIEFTPTKKGTYKYTCWMGMIKNKIVVGD